jgi:3-hydroxyisobutyrate dehydrogenase
MSGRRTAEAIRRVGVVGLGIMGRPMAANLLQAGFEVTVWNRTPGRADPLVARGVRIAESPADVAARAQAVVTMVPDTPDVEAVLFGPAGIARGIREGAVVIDMSTISPSATEGFAAELEKQGAEMLDAPVSGGDKGAIAGTLAIMVGGKPDVFERCRPVLDALGKSVVHMGPHGAGQRTKLVNQVVGALHLVALSEGLAFARAMGLDASRVLEVVSSGAAGSWMLTHLGPRALAGDFTPGFTIHLQRKDLRLAAEALEDVEGDFPGARLALERFTRAEELGFGGLGTQGLLRLYGA